MGEEIDLGTPVGPSGLRAICDEDDDGRRNWFVTLAYRDVARLLAAYTHGKIIDQAVAAGPGTPRPKRVNIETAKKAATAFLGEMLAAADELVKQVDVSEDATRVQLAAGSRTPNGNKAAVTKPAQLVAAMAGLPEPSTTELAASPRAVPDPKEPPLNANFCTFAMWSSLTLGRDIRNSRLPRRFDRIGGLRLRHTLTNLVIEARKTNNMELARLLGLGQRVVLWEVGTGLYSMILGEDTLNKLPSVKALDFSSDGGRGFTDDATRDLAKVIEDDWLAGIVLPRPASGLTQLRSIDLARGLASYHLARLAAQQVGREVDGQAWVAQLILRGNLLIGAYEQRKVDQLLKYPVGDFAAEFFLERSGIAGMESSGDGRWRRRFDARVRRDLLHLPELWGRFFTDQIMVLWAGDELLRLGRDLPFPPGSATFVPEDLSTIKDDWLQSLLLQYDHSYGNGHGTQSRIWSVFEDRMNYIANFMRSRAQTPGLWKEPFEPDEYHELRKFQVPRGKHDASR